MYINLALCIVFSSLQCTKKTKFTCNKPVRNEVWILARQQDVYLSKAALLLPAVGVDIIVGYAENNLRQVGRLNIQNFKFANCETNLLQQQQSRSVVGLKVYAVLGRYLTKQIVTQTYPFYTFQKLNSRGSTIYSFAKHISTLQISCNFCIYLTHYSTSLFFWW